ncbi:hypothetical protein QVD17_22110 [Tagetes erecta]|uniref:Rapid ALkalinization Factor n=1 Tax=Tagetes erecta TaxID=13708 RepID=A0AAD8NTW1_TARER|nr:hypothetical protein QVD17_22110 [Tagetes erecta]
MTISTNLLILHLVFSALVLTSLLSSVSSSADDFTWISSNPISGSGGGGCRGSIGECMTSGEMEMESESTRRILATSNYISYGALQGNNVPCSQRGASYYNCQSGGQANPYQRGCSTITRCAR